MAKPVLAAMAVLFSIFSFPVSAFAQFIGYTSPQTTQQTLFSSAACVGSVTSPNSGPTAITNIGQTVHAVTYTFSGSPTPPQIVIEGSNDGTNFFQISDTGMGAAVGSSSGILIGYGYFPVERVHVTNGTTGCTMTVSYSGTSVTQPNPATGLVDSAAYRKTVFSLQSAGANITSPPFVTPYGSTAGALIVTFAGTGPSPSSISVLCADSSGRSIMFPLSTTATVPQIFPVSGQSCSQLQLFYGSGGASSSTISAIYYFLKPGASQNPACEQSFVINTAAAGPTQILGANVLGSFSAIHICSIDVSSGTAEAVDFQQGTGTNCGTGNSQLTGLIHLAANTPFVRIYPNSSLSGLPGNAVCIHLSGANQTDGTITYSVY